MAASILSELLEYDPTSKSGLRWQVDRKRVKAGDEAGSLYTNPKTGKQYWQVRVMQQTRYAHRLIYEIASGKPIPAGMQIDHKDGDGLNNIQSNLRVVTPAVNIRNSKMRSDNSSGAVGITYGQRDHGYTAFCHKTTGGAKRKFFSCNKHGEEAAFGLALEWREKQMRKLNEAGAGYTERHGTAERMQ